MASGGILKEYLVKLGLQDNMTGKLNKSLNQAGKKASKFAGSFGKQFLFAGTAVATMAAGAGLALGKFIGHLSKTDDELVKFAEDMGVSREEAFKTKSALDLMGKTMDEIAADPRLLKQFEELRANAENIQIPDLSKGLDQVRGVSTEFLKLKQTAMAGLQWVGHYLFKYIDKPLQDVKKTLGGINEFLQKNITKWADKIGMALSWIVRLGTTLIRGAGAVFKAIQRIFDMIPGNVKIAMAAFAALAMFIKMGPIGKLITILTVALMILEDFFTFLDGGDSLLGPFWQILTDLFSGFTDSGEGALKFFSEDFLPGLFDAIGSFFPKTVEKVMSFVEPFIGFAVKVLEGIIKVVTDNLPGLVKLLGDMVNTILNALLEMLPRLIDMGTQLLMSLITGVVDMIPRLVDTLVEIVNKLLDTIMGALPAILEAGVNLIMSLVQGIIDNLPKIVQAALGLVDSLTKTIVANLPKLIQAGVDILKSLLNGIVNALPDLVRAVLDIIPMVARLLLDNLPLILDAGISIIMSLIDGLVEMLPTLIEAAIDLIVNIIDAVTEMLPDIIEMGIQLVMKLIDGIVKALPKIINAIITLIQRLLDAIVKNLPKIIEAGIKMVVSLIQGIMNAYPQIIQAIISLVQSLVTAIVDNLPTFIQAGIQMILSLIRGIIDALPQLIQAVIDLIPVVVQALIGALPQIIEAGIQLLVSLITGIISAIPELIAAIPQIIGAIIGGLASLPGMLLDLGKNIIGSLWDGIKSMGGWIKDKVGGFISGTLEKIPLIGNLFKKKDKDGDEDTGHAEGVISTSEHDARVSEGDKAEAIIPLTKPKRAKQLLNQAASFLGMTGGDPTGEGGKGGGVLPMIDKMKGFIDRASGAMQHMGQMATAGATAGAISNNSNVNDNRSFDMSSSYQIYDTSGNPEATARAVDRTQELRTRNMKGVIQ
jgi:phage-related protein